MIEREKEFDEIFKGEGGRVSNEVYDSPVFIIALTYARNIVQQLERQRQNEIKDPNAFIYVDIINNTSLNTYVARKGNDYFIGICKGTILILASVFFRMMSNKHVLHRIGDISKEEEIEKIFDAQILNSEHLPSVSFEKIAPRDRERWGLAHVFVIQVIEFLIFHEFGHIAGDHINYYYSHPNNSKSGNRFTKRLAELISDYNPCQTLEVIADDFAIRMMVGVLHNSLEENRKMESYTDNDNHYDWPDIMQEWLFPICTFFRMSGYRNYQYSLRDDQYPPPVVRFGIILEIISDCLIQQYNFKDIERLNACFSDVFFEVERAFDKISCQGLDFRSARFSLNENVKAHRERLLEDEIKVMSFLTATGKPQRNAHKE